MAQYFSLDCKLNLKSFIITHLITCRPLLLSLFKNYSETSLVLKSVTEKNSMSCDGTHQ